MFRSTAWCGSQEHDFASVDSQQTCCEHAMNMFQGRAVLLRNAPKIVGFQDEHKGIPCSRMLVRPRRGGSLCHKHFFANFRKSCSWLPRRLCRRTRFIACTGFYISCLDPPLQLWSTHPHTLSFATALRYGVTLHVCTHLTNKKNK